MSTDSCNSDDCFRTISKADYICPLKAAALTAVNDAVIGRGAFDSHGFHHTETRRRTVARVDVYVFPPQTLRAMIGVAVAFHLSAAPLADEIFHAPLKTLAAHIQLTVTDAVRCIASPDAAVHDNSNVFVPRATLEPGTIVEPSFFCASATSPLRKMHGALAFIPTVDHDTTIGFPRTAIRGCAISIATGFTCACALPPGVPPISR